MDHSKAYLSYLILSYLSHLQGGTVGRLAASGHGLVQQGFEFLGGVFGLGVQVAQTPEEDGVQLQAQVQGRGHDDDDDDTTFRWTSSQVKSSQLCLYIDAAP